MRNSGANICKYGTLDHLCEREKMQQIGFALTKGEMMQQLALELEPDNKIEVLHISYTSKIENKFDCWWEIVGGSNP